MAEDTDRKVSGMTIRGDKVGIEGTTAFAAFAIPAAPTSTLALEILALQILALGGLLLLIRP